MESPTPAIGHTPGWIYLSGLEVLDGKLSIVPATEKHGNMPMLGISRYDDDSTFRCDVPGAFWIELQIDFRDAESLDLGLIDISIQAAAGSVIKPTKHQELLGSHKHWIATDAIGNGYESSEDSGFVPRSFQQFIFIGVLSIGDFHIAFDFENAPTGDTGIKSDLLIRRMGVGTDYLEFEGPS